MEKLEHLYIAGQMQNGAATVKNGSESAKILSTEFPYDLAIALKRWKLMSTQKLVHKCL